MPNGIRKYGLIFFAVLCGTSCTNTWPQEEKEQFVQSCIEQVKQAGVSDAEAKTRCDCRLDKIMKKYPNVEDALANMDKLASDTSITNCK